MIPLQVKLSFTSQNFNHRQSASVLFRQYESRKQSPVTHVVVTHNPRRSHQFDGRSISPSKILTTSHVYPKIIQSTELKTRIPTQVSPSLVIQGQSIPIQEALKIYSAKTNTDSQYNSNKVSSYIQEKINEKSNYTKTTTGESQDDEKSSKQKPSIIYQKQLLDKDLQIMQLQKELKQIKESNKKYQNIEKEYDKLLQENQKLKLQIQLQQVQITQLTHQQSLISPGRPSEYVSALSEQDKLKIKTLLECE
ncbi:unnamed protein product (macronuclear) [Paramecium tetraurelia]|uniref:Uncharacterized protein n=1 Tax=Paramecium tetraurelia TaxID=5888 RepID=A0BZE2_PARTE|nr:uncharacterized protein GSPATT00033762001 [Paramecium tetraurelia]CAK63909.1 unnamed protein product [Paramecium tetraurelia]|eukprot:XP_001431307.1 hypothetical protein (macronuclear) [Paramecium tetraurelia strain d4-2]